MFSEVTDREVARELMSIKSGAIGSDGLNIKMINYCCPHILPCIRDIINTCISCGRFPDAWKKSIVLPLPKNKNPKACSDLRPVSILPVLSKLLEKILYNQLMTYIVANNILPIEQSGFRAGFSCTTALMNIVDDIVRATDKGKATILCLLDYSKAFDRIDHRLLSSILHYVGLGDGAVGLVMDYLSRREQVVVINENKSDSIGITRGCPQGSVLSPLIFSIYISNFKNYTHNCDIHWYADDTQLYISFCEDEVGDACTKLNSDIHRIVDMSAKHGLEINAAKTELILFGPKRIKDRIRDSINIHIAGVALPLSNAVKSLGVLIDENLRFDAHINKCVSRAYASLRSIYTNRKFINKNTKRLLCDTMVLTHFNYASPLYYPFLSSVLKSKIQKVQNSCLRLMFGLRRRDHVSCKLAEADWLCMNARRLVHATILFRKIIVSEKPAYLFNKITVRSDVHTLNPHPLARAAIWPL